MKITIIIIIMKIFHSMQSSQCRLSSEQLFVRIIEEWFGAASVVAGTILYAVRRGFSEEYFAAASSVVAGLNGPTDSAV